MKIGNPEDNIILPKKETITNEVLSPIKELVFDTKAEYEENCPNKYLTHPYEHCTTVSQGGVGIYEGKPLHSDGFTRCSGVILESARASMIIHVDTNDFWMSKIGKIKKYFEGEDTKVILVKGDLQWRADEIYYHLKEMKIPVIESKVIKVPSGTKYWWAMAYDPVEGQVSVHTEIDHPKQKVLTFDTGKSNYNLESFKESQDFFESRDYMPKGFRQAQRFFKDQNFNIEEYMFDTWKIDSDQTIAKALRFKEEDTLVVWTPASGFVEKKISPSDIVADVMLPEWDPLDTLLFVKSPVDEKDSSGKAGYVRGFVPDYGYASLYYEINNKLTREEIRARCIASKNRSNV